MSKEADTKRGRKSDGVTTEDIARKTGLSKMTVSRVLNDHPYVSDDTRKKVLHAVDELGFRPNVLAKRFFTGKTQLVGVMMPLEFMFQSFYFKDLFQGIMKRMEEEDYDILLHDSLSSSSPVKEKCLNLVKGKLAEGLLICAPMKDDHYPLELTQDDVPLVVLGENPDQGSVNQISISNRAGSEEAATQLIAAGHRRIAILSFDTRHVESQQRVDGFRDALKKAGIEFDEALNGEAKYSRQEGFRETQRILKEFPDVTAIYATNGEMALGACDAARHMGIKIPEDLSIVAFDDYDAIEHHEPAISAVRQHPFKVGYAGADVLFQLINGKLDRSDVHHREVPTDFVDRASIAAPRQ